MAERESDAPWFSLGVQEESDPKGPIKTQTMNEDREQDKDKAGFRTWSVTSSLGGPER